MNKIIILILLTTNVFSQVITDKGWLLEKDKVVKLDYWARKGIACTSAIDQALELVNQIAKAKIESDSISIVLQRTMFVIKNEIDIEKAEKNKLIGINQQLSINNKNLEEELRKQNKKLILSYGVSFLLFVGGIFIATK